MKNKFEFKKYLKKTFFCILIFSILLVFLCTIQYHIYKVNFNYKIYSIINLVKEKYPTVLENEIIQLLNKDSVESFYELEKYGIDIDKDSIIQINDSYFLIFTLLNLLFLFLFSIFLISIYLKHNKKKNKDIEEISSSIEQINRGNYKLNIENNTEDELSILKNEVYKTMIMLKEGKENSLQDKISLKKSLSDISHQLKTPLTSIMISLDNLEDNPDLDSVTREKFLRMIKRDICSIHFLVQSLLQLSRLDTNTVEFTRKNVKIDLLIKESLSQIENLCDLRNIKIHILGSVDKEIYCDFIWQKEALTNIIKNAVEYASSEVKICVFENNVYFKIQIINDGMPISKKDLPHIFERFYKGENQKADSIGIGLSLAKKIIESDCGSIEVESNKSETVFTIKYFKREYSLEN